MNLALAGSPVYSTKQCQGANALLRVSNVPRNVAAGTERLSQTGGGWPAGVLSSRNLPFSCQTVPATPTCRPRDRGGRCPLPSTFLRTVILGKPPFNTAEYYVLRAHSHTRVRICAGRTLAGKASNQACHAAAEAQNRAMLGETESQFSPIGTALSDSSARSAVLCQVAP